MSVYIDVDDALKRVGGNADLYKRLLKRFLDGNDFESLDNAFKNNDIEEAARLAHTIKGVSANLSLIKVRDVSTDLEHLIKDGLDCPASLAELQQAFSDTKDKIAEYIG